MSARLVRFVPEMDSSIVAKKHGPTSIFDDFALGTGIQENAHVHKMGKQLERLRSGLDRSQLGDARRSHNPSSTEKSMFGELLPLYFELRICA